MRFFKREKKPKKTTNEIIRETIEKEKNKILKKNRVDLQVPYTRSGVAGAIVGGAFFGKTGAVLGALNEGGVSWKYTKMFLNEKELHLKSSSSLIYYNNIIEVILGDKSFLSTTCIIATKDSNNIVFKAPHYVVRALKEIIESRIPESSDDESMEDLLKYADLVEKGLISKEEFDKIKNKLLN